MLRWSDDQLREYHSKRQGRAEANAEAHARRWLPTARDCPARSTAMPGGNRAAQWGGRFALKAHGNRLPSGR